MGYLIATAHNSSYVLKIDVAIMGVECKGVALSQFHINMLQFLMSYDHTMHIWPYNGDLVLVPPNHVCFPMEDVDGCMSGLIVCLRIFSM